MFPCSYLLTVALKGLMKTSYLRQVSQTISQITHKQIQLWEFQRNQQKAVDVDACSSLTALTLGMILNDTLVML